MKNINKIIFWFILTFMISNNTSLCAQEIEIKGEVRDEQGQELIGANVVGYDKENNIIGYDITNELGVFNMEFNTSSVEILKVSYLGYETKRILEPTKTNQGYLKVVLKEHSNLLEEVVVKSSFKERDTVSFSLKDLNIGDDSNLEEVLKKMPNFKIGKNGAIIYKGHKIDKILVNEGLAFENQNSVALKNIEKDIIEELSVIKNYKDEFIISFDETEEYVLNINTKQTKSNKIRTAKIETGAGVTKKYDFRGAYMHFEPKSSFIGVTENNNIGALNFNLGELNYATAEIVSNYQLNSLSRLISFDEQLSIKEFNMLNLSARHHAKNIRIQTVSYLMESRYEKETLKEQKDIEGGLVQEQRLDEQNKIPSFINKTSLDFRLNKRMILNYSISGLVLKDNFDGSIENISTQDTLLNIQSNEKLNKSLGNSLSLYYKLLPKIILKPEILYVVENNSFENYKSVNSHRIQYYHQQKRYTNKLLKAKLNITYKVGKKFILGNESYLDKRLESLWGVKDDYSQERTTIKGGALFSVKNKVHKSLDIKFLGGLAFKLFELEDNKNMKYINFPFLLDILYKKRLNELSITLGNKYLSNDLLLNDDYFLIRDEVNLSSMELISSNNNHRKATIKYGFYNSFKGKSLSIELGLNNYKDFPIRSFLRLNQYGTSFYENTLGENAYSTSLTLDGSKVVNKLRYPLNIGLIGRVSKDRFPIKVADEPETIIDTKRFGLDLNVISLSKKILNIKYKSNLSLTIWNIGEVENKQLKFDNSISFVLFKKNKWKIENSFIYSFQKIDNREFDYFNIHTTANYKLNKRLTVGIDSRYIEQILGLKNYRDVQFSIDNGLTTKIQNSNILSYLLIKLKYKL